MKVRKTNKTGKKKWLLDIGKINGKRQRLYFETEEEAEDAMAIRKSTLKRGGEDALAMPLPTRSEYISVDAQIKAIDPATSITQVFIFWKTHREKFKPVPLTQAIADCVAAKVASGKREYYTNALKRSLKLLGEACPSETTASVTQKQIEHWARNGKSGKLTMATARGRLIEARTLFNFCLKRKWILESPCVGIEPVQLEEKPPGIHTVEQVKTLLGAALKHDRALLGYLCPIYFGGLRPSESAKLSKSEVHKDFIEVQGPKGKGRRRRFAAINEVLAAWLAVPGAKFGMSKRSRKLEKIRWIAGGRKMTKNKKGRLVRDLLAFPWPHDCLRHSFCSYSLPKYGAAVTAANAGHSEQILFAHYRERVRPDDVAAYWALRP